MDLESHKKDFNNILEYFNKGLQKLQTWKASLWVIEDLDVYVPSYGQTQKLQWLWNISMIDPQTIKIESWDKSVLWSIEKAIYDADLWFTPINQGERIMIKIPPMTEERRKDIVKLLKKELEESKIKVRNLRHEILKEIKSEFDEKEISEDEKKWLEKKLDEKAKEYTKKLDDMAKEKESSIMKI